MLTIDTPLVCFVDALDSVTMKNGRPALRAVCAECGTGKYRIGASD